MRVELKKSLFSWVGVFNPEHSFGQRKDPQRRDMAALRG